MPEVTIRVFFVSTSIAESSWTISRTSFEWSSLSMNHALLKTLRRMVGVTQSCDAAATENCRMRCECSL